MIDWRWFKLYNILCYSLRGNEAEALAQAARLLRAKIMVDRGKGS